MHTPHKLLWFSCLPPYACSYKSFLESLLDFPPCLSPFCTSASSSSYFPCPPSLASKLCFPLCQHIPQSYCLLILKSRDTSFSSLILECRGHSRTGGGWINRVSRLCPAYPCKVRAQLCPRCCLEQKGRATEATE